MPGEVQAFLEYAIEQLPELDPLPKGRYVLDGMMMYLSCLTNRLGSMKIMI
jgi:hypothetical protein